jgi:GT2 family glycosyltransferase
MRTTVLLLSWDEAGHLRRSLPAAMAQEGAEVVVVDNASSDDTEAVAREHGARYERLERRLSYAAVTNEALRRTGGEAVLLLNADCYLEPGFLAIARPRLEEPGVGSVAPKLLRALGPDPGQRLDAIDAAGLVVDRRRKNALVGHGRPGLAYDRPGEAFGADGAAALYRREALEDCAIDGEVLDEDLERWASDVDLAWRARLLGWRCVYEPRATAYHVRYYSPSTRARVPERDRTMQFRNRYLMMVKNDTVGALARDAHRVAAYELLAFGYALLRERHLLHGYGAAARLARRARRRRAVLRRRLRSRGEAASVPFGLEPAP